MSALHSCSNDDSFFFFHPPFFSSCKIMEGVRNAELETALEKQLHRASLVNTSLEPETVKRTVESKNTCAAFPCNSQSPFL